MLVPLTAISTFFLATQATADTQLVGTWSTKSRNVSTGPGFYDPIKDHLKEPALTGISYSFTVDGFFEEAYYRAISNPSNPECAEGIMQWQHGTYSIQPNGSLVLTPFAADGRQLLSSPCAGDNSVYSKYNQTELFKSYRVYTDPFHNVMRLDLYRFDGSPMNPMYLIFQPPEMLPTTTLHPPAQASTTGKVKRATINNEATEPLNKKVFLRSTDFMSADRWWWIGVIMTSFGGLILILS